MRSTRAFIMLLHVCVVFATFFSLGDAYGSGAPVPQACAGAQPIHTTGGNPVQPLNPANNPYSFNVAVSEYVAGETLQVTIAEASGGMVNGFFLQARRTDTGVPVGNFEGPLPTGAQLRRCTSDADSVTHTNANGKTGLTFTWLAPPAGTGEVKFVGAVAIDHDNFYGGMMSSMLQEASAMNTTGGAVTMGPTNTTDGAVTMGPTNTTDGAVTMGPTNTTDGAGPTTSPVTQRKMESTTADAVMVSSGFGVLLLAFIASILQLIS